MATKARQQYHADETTLSKERREFSISDEVQEKIDWIEEGAQVNTIETIRVNWSEVQPDENKAIDLTIPWVIDSLSSTSITDALSARQWKILYDKIDNISRIWHFLALWDASTWLPVTDPETSPYEYHAGDFYTISIIAAEGGTNYKPSWTEYISWQASTAVETDDVEVNDFYFYDGQVWRHMKNSWAGDVVVDGSLSTTSRNPVENRVITNALSWKQNTLTAWANIQINWNTISATDTKYTAWTNVQISNQNVISATDTKYTAWTWINIDANNVISNTQTSAEWWNITWTLSDQTDLQNALDAKQDDMVILSYGNSTWDDFITAYNKNWVIYCRASSNSNPASWSQTRLAFMAYVNNETAPTEVEFQYYRSRSSHSTAATVLDEVYVYKLVPANGWTWTVTQRDTAAKPIAWTWIWLTYNASGMTISADTTTLATKTDLNSKANATDVNTKTFYLSGTSDLTNAQAAYDWYKSWKNIIIVYLPEVSSASYNMWVYIPCTPQSVSSNVCNFISVYKAWEQAIAWDNAWWWVYEYILYFSISGSTVTSINRSTRKSIANFLATDKTNRAYTPTNNYHPATKKYVDDKIIASATAPSSPTEWMVWYDTTNDQLKVYDGTNWNVTGKEYIAGEWIEIKNWPDYSAMQWPAPDGFHVPSKDEWVALCDILTTTFWLTSDNTTMETYLKLPSAGGRNSSANIVSQDSAGFYWSSTWYDTNGAYRLLFNSSSLNPQNILYRVYGFSIRCFKDTPVVPDNNWTTLYDGSSIATWAGVYYNSTLWLISVSWDWTTWYTIQDKNLWATTVYNSWDTLSESNCGNYYQRWNNYWFPRTGSVTTSSTKVDASNYWPWNYYNSSIFITASAMPYNWDISDNWNLRWWVTWVVTFDNAITNTGVLSVNGQTGDVTIESWWLQVSPNSTITGIKYIWYGTESDYANLSQYYTDTPWDTEFHCF